MPIASVRSFRPPLRARLWRAMAEGLALLSAAFMRAHRLSLLASEAAHGAARAARHPRGRTFTAWAWIALALLLAAYAAVTRWS